ncbi:hypothetical protein FQR65_LT11249 [Abscondita terminalis]|nr:hypothetical protein FQR65_LT11249 [Abscondita terminalis]
MNQKNRFIDPIGWSLQDPFPNTVTIGTEYEAVYQLVSNLPVPMPAPLTVTYTGGSDFTVEDQCSGLFLVPGQTCNVTVRFTPSNAGTHQFQLTLHYFSDVVPLPVQTMTAEGSTTLIVGSVTQALPATTVVESIYPVIFTFQNVSGSAATHLDLQRNYPTDFTEESNTCTTTLAAGASCIVQGSLIPSAPGTYEVAADLYYAESVTPASVSTSTGAIVITVTGVVTTSLPHLTVVGESFPVVFAYTNNSDLPATGVTITTDYPPGFTQQSDNCTGTLNAHSSCTIQGTFTPATAGNFTVGTSLAYAESSNPVPLSTSTTADVGALGIVGDVTTPLPATTSIDVSYPVVFTYTNEGSVTATSLDITPNYPPGFTQQSNTCSGSLPVGAACTVTGTLLPTSAGNYTVDVSLAYAQSVNPVPLSTSTSAIVVDIIGEVSTPLPTTTALNTSYPVVFSYTNNSAITATDLVLTPNYPAGFTEEENSCSSGTLAAGQTCSIEGNFIPPNSGTYTVATSLTYAGGPAAIPLSTSTDTLEFVLTGEVSTSLPGSLELGNEYPVVFTYTNDSPLAATNLVFTSDYPTDFMQDTDTCTSTLASHSSCAVSGTLTPSNNTPPGPVTVGLSLTYSEGSPIELTTSSVIASQIDISGDVTESLPPVATASATPLPVVFQYTNNGNAPATGLNLTTHYPTEFTQTSITCIGTLGVGASCQITGTLDISSPGSYSVGVTLNTNEATPVTLTTGTSIIAAEVLGSVTQKLPSSTVVGTSYPVAFLFTNEGAVDATSVNIVKTYPVDFVETSNTCGATLVAGASCRVQGALTPTSEGPQTVGLTFEYAEGANIPLSTSTTVGMLVLQGFVQQGFPDVASANTTYPLIFKYTNPGPGDATGLSISSTPAATNLVFTSDYPTDFMQDTDTCTSTLASHSSCAVSGTLTPSNNTPPGPVTVGLSLTYSEGSPIELTTSSVIASQIDISGDVTESLPPVATASATPLPVVFQYTNNGNAPATGLNLTTHYPTEFTQTSITCIGTLGVGASCQITGTLDISSPGSYSVGVTLNTNEATPVTLTTGTSIIAAEVLGSVTQKLPSSTVVGTSYPVAFLFTNEGAVDATSVNIVKTYPVDFVETSNTCGATLVAGASCRVQGALTPTSEGPQTVGLTFEYAEGANIPLSTSTTVGMLVLQGFVQQGFPDVASANTTYPLIFKYTNPGPGDATGLSISSTPGLDITSDTCSGILAVGASCIVEANFTPTQFGAYTAGVTLSYDQGEDIPLNTYTVIGTNLVLAVGSDGFRYTLTGTETRAWVNRSSGLAEVNFNGVAFSPKLQLYVLVGNISSGSGGTRGLLQTTVDGISYDMPPWNPSFLPRNIIWNPDLAQFLALGVGGGIATSVDGVNWVTQTSPVNATLNNAIWSSQRQQYVAVGSNGTILTSPNGIDWQSQTSGVSDTLTDIAWSPSLSLYVISTLSEYILNSSDGSTWINPGADMKTAMEEIAWSPELNLFSIVGEATVYGWSSDGQNWSFDQPGLVPDTLCVTWSPGRKRFFSGGTEGTLRYSLDGMSYNRPATGTGFRNVYGIAAGTTPD